MKYGEDLFIEKGNETLEQIKKTNCRICLKKDGSEASHEIIELKFGKKSALDVIDELFGIKIEPEYLTDMVTPNVLCNSCKMDLGIIFAFRNKIQKTQEKLKDFMSREELIQVIENPKKGPAKEQKCGTTKIQIAHKPLIDFHPDFHKRTQLKGKRFKCEDCSKNFFEKSCLRRHKMTHTGEKPHKCNICDKNFGRKSSLQRHLMIHTGERPFICGICNKNYNRKDYFRHHMKKTHSNNHELLG